MERTELREAFFAETRRDPYAHMVVKLFADAWATGYEQALRDHGLTDARLRETHGDRESRAVEYVTAMKREADAKALIALAQVGSLIGGPQLGG